MRIPSILNQLFVLISCLPLSLSAQGEPKVDFAREVRPILSNYCFHCHGPDDKNRKGGDGNGLRLDQEDGAFADIGGKVAVVL